MSCSTDFSSSAISDVNPWASLHIFPLISPSPGSQVNALLRTAALFASWSASPQHPHCPPAPPPLPTAAQLPVLCIRQPHVPRLRVGGLGRSAVAGVWSWGGTGRMRRRGLETSTVEHGAIHARAAAVRLMAAPLPPPSLSRPCRRLPGKTSFSHLCVLFPLPSLSLVFLLGWLRGLPCGVGRMVSSWGLLRAAAS